MEQHAISSDLIRGHIDTIILHTLTSGDKFAQQISDAIEEKSEKEYKINQATLYSSLKRLENLRYVKAYWNDSENGRRKYFKLTESGSDFVEKNLSSWSFSRAIIDKLMDCEPQTVYKTQIVEKIIEKPVEIFKEVSPVTNIDDKNLTSNNNLTDNLTDKSAVINVENQAEQKSTDNSQDINFRNILNGLIKTTAVQKTPVLQEELMPLEKASDPDKPVEIQKFNETLTSTDYNAQRSNNGKIDFGDLILNAAKEGYKIRISSKDSFVTKGTLLQNKLNASVAVIAYLLALFPLLIISFTVGASFPLKSYVAIIGATLFAITPIVYLIKYWANPKFLSTKQVNRDEIFTSIIIVFNVLIITLALNVILKVDFANISVVAFTLILPIILSLIFVGCFIIKYNLSKAKAFKVNANNN